MMPAPVGTSVRRGSPDAAVRRSRLHRPDLRVEKELLRGGCARLAAMDEVGRGALAGPVTVGVVVVTSSIGRVPAGLRDSKLLTPAARDRLVAPVRRWAVEWAVGHAGPDEIDAYGIMTGLRMAAHRALAQLSGPVDAVLLDGNHDYLNSPAQGSLFDPDEPGDVDGRCQLGGDEVSGGDAAAVGMSVTGGIPAVPAVSVTDGMSVVPVVGVTGGTSFLPPPPVPAATAAAVLPVHLRIKADLRCAGVAAASVLAKTTRDAMMVEFAGGYPVYGWAVNKGYATPEHLAALAEHGPCELHRRSWRLSGPVPVDPVVEDGQRTAAGRPARQAVRRA